MRTLIFDSPQIVTEEELEADLLKLPAWRREQAVSFRFHLGRVLCSKAYLLLMQGLGEQYGIRRNQDFSYTDSGKPGLKEHPEIHFSLSHCKNGILCAIDDRPIGCDIEYLDRKFDENLCRYCCSASEADDIMSSASPSERFAEFWTRKEAFVKYTGEGISNDMKHVLDRTEASSLILETHVCREKGYVWSVCHSAGSSDISF